MIYIFNGNTIIAAFFGLLGGFGVYSLTRNSTLAWLAGAASAIVFDIIMRLRNKEEDAPIIHPKAGAHIWFVPVWIIGLIVTVIGILSWLRWL
jgi:hypothetical protein